MTIRKVLVVDDEVVIRNFLVRVIQQAGYRVQSANNGRMALEMLQHEPFDLLLTDIKMDVMDGVTLLYEAKKYKPNLAVILLTGHATVPSAVAALRQGANDYLLKPVKNEEILAAIANALESQEREQRRNALEDVAEQFAGALLHSSSAQPQSPKHILTCGEIRLDTTAYRASLNDTLLDLTPTEYRLLHELCHSPGVALSYVELVQSACGYTCSRQEAREIIGTHVLNLRQKMGIEPNQLLYVESVRGIGYRLIPPNL